MLSISGTLGCNTSDREIQDFLEFAGVEGALAKAWQKAWRPKKKVLQKACVSNIHENLDHSRVSFSSI